jgi:acetamidase/formamidase
MIHEIPLERRTLHGHFSVELAPIAAIEPGDSIAFSTIDAGWGIEAAKPDSSDRKRFEPRDAALDDGHALIGPIEVSGAKAGQTLAVRVDELRVGSYGLTDAGGSRTKLNVQVGVEDPPTRTLSWKLDAGAGIGRDHEGRAVRLRPFLGVMGMPPPYPGVHPTSPPRIWGGNIDCTDLGVGATLFLPIPVDGALFSAGDGHARQGDGEVSGLAIECPIERAVLTLDVRDDVSLETAVARTPDAWITFGFDEDLDDAAAQAVGAMLDLMEREHGLERRDALALAKRRRRPPRDPARQLGQGNPRRPPRRRDRIRWETMSCTPSMWASKSRWDA